MSHVRSVARYLLGAIVLAAGSLAPAADALQDPLQSPGFVHFFNNEYDEALAFFEQELKANPDDPAQYTNVAQSILYRELFRDGALESQLVTGNNTF